MNNFTISPGSVSNDGFASLGWFYHKSGRIIPKTKFLDWLSKGVISGQTLLHTKSSSFHLISISSVVRHLRNMIQSFSTNWVSGQADVETLAVHMDIPKYSVYRIIKSASSGGISRTGRKYVVDIKLIIDYLSNFADELERFITPESESRVESSENSELQVVNV